MKRGNGAHLSVKHTTQAGAMEGIETTRVDEWGPIISVDPFLLGQPGAAGLWGQPLHFRCLVSLPAASVPATHPS